MKGEMIENGETEKRIKETLKQITRRVRNIYPDILKNFKRVSIAPNEQLCNEQSISLSDIF